MNSTGFGRPWYKLKIHMQPLTVQATLLDDFITTASKAVATVEVIDRSPAALAHALLRALGDITRILFATPNELPASLFADLCSRSSGAAPIRRLTRWFTRRQV